LDEDERGFISSDKILGTVPSMGHISKPEWTDKYLSIFVFAGIILIWFLNDFSEMRFVTESNLY